MTVLQLASALRQTTTGATAALSHDYSLHIDVLEPWLCRVAITPDSGDYIANSWMIGPPDSTPQWQGRDRLDTGGYSAVAVELTEDAQALAM